MQSNEDAVQVPSIVLHAVWLAGWLTVGRSVGASSLSTPHSTQPLHNVCVFSFDRVNKQFMCISLVVHIHVSVDLSTQY